MNLNATILGQAIAFVLFVLFCMKYVWPPLMAAIEKRQKEIADGLASAERRSQMLDEAKAEAEQERTKIVAQAQAEIEAERKRAREELRKQVAILAVAGAEKIIERSVDEAANSDIVDKLVAEL